MLVDARAFSFSGERAHFLVVILNLFCKNEIEPST